MHSLKQCFTLNSYCDDVYCIIHLIWQTCMEYVFQVNIVLISSVVTLTNGSQESKKKRYESKKVTYVKKEIRIVKWISSTVDLMESI